MAIPSGLAAQAAIAEPNTYGAFTTPSRFYEFTDESLALTVERLDSVGLRAGTRILRSDRWREGQKSIAGDLNMEVANKSFGLWLKHMLGGSTVSTPGGATDARLHTYTPDDLPTNGLVVQVGKPDAGGTVRAFTYQGVKVASWNLASSVGEFLTMGVSLAGQDEVTSESLATASYPSDLDLFTFVHGTLTVGGSAVEVRSFELTGDNGLSVDRHRFGSQKILNPIETAMREYGGTFDAVWDSLTLYNNFVNGTEASLNLTFEAPETIESTTTYKLEVTANVRTDGDTPAVGGTDEIPQNITFMCLDTGSGADSALTIEYRTDDTSP